MLSPDRDPSLANSAAPIKINESRMRLKIVKIRMRVCRLEVLGQMYVDCKPRLNVTVIYPPVRKKNAAMTYLRRL